MVSFYKDLHIHSLKNVNETSSLLNSSKQANKLMNPYIVPYPFVFMVRRILCTQNINTKLFISRPVNNEI